MDALEYEKTRVRMCRTMIYKEGGCGACPIYNVLKRRCGLTVPVTNDVGDDYCRKTVSAVEDWAKKHPIKTRKSDFLKLFPDANMDGIEKTWCVAQFDKTRKCDKNSCGGSYCKKCQEKFWNEEVSE